MSEYVANIAEQYFSTLNPIAARLHSDIIETKNAYEKLWDQLSPQEQSQIINESIIKPEVLLKYGLCTKSDKEEKQVYGQKIIHDEHFVYRDEFSAPFSYKTQSQMDLRVFSEAPVLPGSPLLKSDILNKNVSSNKEKEIFADKLNILIDDGVKYNIPSFDNYDDNLSKYEDNISKYDDNISKNSSPSETMNETPSDTSQDEKTCLLPATNVLKTGYDFLDNW